MSYIAQAVLDAAITGVEMHEEIVLPDRFTMDLFPNPFNGLSVVQITVPHRAPVHLRVVNLLGEVVIAYSAGYLEAGTHRLSIILENLPSGIYIVDAILGGRTLQKKAMLIR